MENVANIIREKEMDSNKTPQAKIDKYAIHIFEDAQKFQDFLRREYAHCSNKKLNTVAIGGILYTMMEYDLDGRNIEYGNMRTGNIMAIETRDRYEDGFGDAVVSIEEDPGYLREGINYID